MNKKILFIKSKMLKICDFHIDFQFQTKKYSQGTCRRAKTPGGPCLEKPLNAPNPGL